VVRIIRSVGAIATVELVRPRAAAQIIVARISKERIIPLAAIEGVVIFASRNTVRPLIAEGRVVAGLAFDRVVSAGTAAVKAVVAVAAQDRVGRRAARDAVPPRAAFDAGADGDVRLSRDATQRDRIIARQAQDADRFHLGSNEGRRLAIVGNDDGCAASGKPQHVGVERGRQQHPFFQPL
jgi:hypothetical protein